ncbi:manganese efflux pump MntP family protein [Clostridium felsineum]|uniref:manganese efflux pump MntP n=1 Tax=Clostridium felsineum TaxID=36839 RepID=UPI00214D7184|nr:manganese efflux pump MntP family protein [Clostridium felsineum]MCR3761766.1 manganese efflux pump MntP family protein [Clostridium felsineum]
MNIYSLLMIAIALSLDAFGVALSIGLDNSVKRNNKILFSISFGFFQFLCTFIGAYSGFLFNTYITYLPQIIGGIIIAFVGMFMIKEGFEDKEEKFLLNFKMYFVLGISVSIDAAVIGFTMFNKISSNSIIFMDSIFIGIITLILSAVAFILSRYLKKITLVCKYADYIGGIILILFGIKMMFF